MVAAERKMVAPGAADMTSRFSSEFVQDLPVAGRFYQNVLSLPPGEEAEPRERLLDAAFRVLADLAYDGKLSPSEGRPALAALLGAQRPSGAIADDVAVHAVATWALAEASAVLPRDTWVATARSKAVDYLSSLALKDGWPARPGGAVGAEATRWARLVMGAIRPSSIASIPKPKDDPSGNFAKLTRSLTAGRGSATALASGRAPFDRLVATVGRGHLKVVRG